MNPFLLYLLLLKATMTSFSGLASLPIIRNDLVLHRRVLTDRDLNAAVAAGRAGPGPIGLYVVSVGYFAGGVPGAVAGWLAMNTPAFLIIPLMRFTGSRLANRRIRSVLEGVSLAAAGLILASTVPLARGAITGPVQLAIALAAAGLLMRTRVDTFWVILTSAAAGLAAHFLGAAI